MEAPFPTHAPIALLLRLLYQHHAQDIEAALSEAGFGDLRPPHANVFPFVPPQGITVSELAELARVRKQTMAQAVEQLERMGYVERRPNPRDRRARRGALGRADEPRRARGDARLSDASAG